MGLKTLTIALCLLTSPLFALDFGDIPADTNVTSLWVAPARTLTIGGVTFDLSANRTWTASTILDQQTETQGAILYRAASNWVGLGPGTDGNVLTTHGPAANPTWTTPSEGTVDVSGTPTTGQMAQWTDANTVKGVTLSGSGATMSIGTTGVVTISAIADASLTNPQTYSAIVPNTAPTSGQILIGNAGNTAYAKNSISGSGATISLGATGVITISGIANASLTNSAITIAGTSTALGGTITLDTITGVSSNGFLTRTGANTLTNTTAPAGAVVGTTDTQTLTNKRINPRVTSISSNATWAPSADTDDVYEITAQAAAVTTISNPSGTPVDGQKLIIRATCDGTNRALTFSGSQWRASSDLSLPTTLLANKTTYMGFMFNSLATKWDMIAKIENF